MDSVMVQIKEIAVKYNIRKVVLYGSRARGDNTAVSDYDIAIFTNNLSAVDRASFCIDVEEIETLKKIDVVFVDETRPDALLENIMREGVVIYEQIENKTD